MGRWFSSLLGACVAVLLCAPLLAGEPARVAIVIDDIGDNLPRGQQALALPGMISFAFLPHTAHAPELARAVHASGRDVMLHLPMQSEAHLRLLGPGALMQDMDETRLQTQFIDDLSSVPYVRGFNNHMGSVLTRDRKRMQWLMKTAKERDLFFVDSRTTTGSVAAAEAVAAGLVVRGRDVFLDHEANIETIRKQYRRLLRIAREHGSAVAIGHPYPETLQVLAEELPLLLGQADLQLVAVSQMSVAGPTRWNESLMAANLKNIPRRNTFEKIAARASLPGNSFSSSTSSSGTTKETAASMSKAVPMFTANMTALAASSTTAAQAKSDRLHREVSAQKIGAAGKTGTPPQTVLAQNRSVASKTRTTEAQVCAPLQIDPQRLRWHQAMLNGEQFAQWLQCQQHNQAQPQQAQSQQAQPQQAQSQQPQQHATVPASGTALAATSVHKT